MSILKSKSKWYNETISYTVNAELFERFLNENYDHLSDGRPLQWRVRVIDRVPGFSSNTSQLSLILVINNEHKLQSDVVLCPQDSLDQLILDVLPRVAELINDAEDLKLSPTRIY